MIQSIDQLCADWLAQFKKESTHTTYRQRFQPFAAGLTIDMLKSLTPEDVASRLRNDQSAASSQRTTRIAAKSFLKFAGEQGFCDRKLHTTIKIEEKAPLPVVEVYSSYDRDRVINEETIPRNQVILWLMLTQDFKVAEILQLTWYNVDYSENKIQYTASRCIRRVFIPEPFWSQLISLRNHRSSDDYIFHGPQRTGLNHRQVKDIGEDALKRSGINAKFSEVCTGGRISTREYRLL